MCFIVEKLSLAKISGCRQTKSNFVYLRTSDIKFFWWWFFLKSLNISIISSMVILLNSIQPMWKTDPAYLSLFNGYQSRTCQQFSWTTTCKHFHYIALQIHLRCFCGLECQVSGRGQQFHKWHNSIHQNIRLTQIFCGQSLLDVNAASMP